jgi:transposase
MPAKYVRPYSKGQKNDFRDAEAIAEAVQRPTMKFVATKTADQLDLQAPHRVRERFVSQRTGIINQIRAFLRSNRHVLWVGSAVPALPRSAMARVWLPNAIHCTHRLYAQLARQLRLKRECAVFLVVSNRQRRCRRQALAIRNER